MDSELKDRIENKLKTIRFINASAEYAAREIMGIIAPELEKARFWDEHVKSLPEIANNIKQLRADAEKWKRVKEIIDPSQLRTLAAWIDIKYPNDPNPQVQNDLRKWAEALEGEGEKG